MTDNGMIEFLVTIERKITRVIKVPARSLKAARQEIEAYGPDVAWSDYQDVDGGSDTTRITRITKQA